MPVVVPDDGLKNQPEAQARALENQPEAQARAHSVGGRLLAEDRSGFLGRLLGKTKQSTAAEREELPIPQPTIGLCFDYERGVACDSAYLSDIGLERILEVLRGYGLRATFHCPAKLCTAAPDRLKMIAEAGHELGVLGYADESPRDLSDDALRQMVLACRTA